MTDDSAVLDVETEEITDALDTRPFKVVTHKPAVVAVLAPFGGTQDIGITVDSKSADRTLWWMSTDWAVQVLKAGIPLPQLTAPGAGFVAGLPQRFLNRRVGTLRKGDVVRYYEKHPDAAAEHPQIVLSIPGEITDLLSPEVVQSADLARGVFPPNFARLPETTLLQLDQMLACVVEVRCWVAHREVVAAAPYRLGMVGWDSALFQEMMFNAEGQQLAQGAVDVAKVIAAEVDGPPGYALDIGVSVDGITTVLRAWPSWAVEPLHAEPTGVFAALAAAHDFDHTGRWRWNPDLDVYAREEAQQPTTTQESEDSDV